MERLNESGGHHQVRGQEDREYVRIPAQTRQHFAQTTRANRRLCADSPYFEFRGSFLVARSSPQSLMPDQVCLALAVLLVALYCPFFQLLHSVSKLPELTAQVDGLVCVRRPERNHSRSRAFSPLPVSRTGG